MSGCLHCGADAVIEADITTGTTVCTSCGAVLEENAIVAEVTFGEASSGAAIVQGSYVSAGSTGVKSFGPRGRQPQESREQTLANGRRKIYALAHGLGLGDSVSEQAGRLFVLAVTNRFVQGRRTEYVVASCLYVAARMAKTSHMLIDMSDFLRINVFVLGATYLKLVKELALGPQIPAIDPSLYISRFASLLEFGDETQRVAQDAIRLVQRFNRDWMQTGRRPAGICGACLLLAARMNNFRRSIAEIVQVVKIADITVRRRLDEFKATPSGALSIEQFRTVWLEEYADPPAFIEGQKSESEKRKPKKRRKKGQADSDEEDQDEAQRNVESLLEPATDMSPGNVNGISSQAINGKGKGKADQAIVDYEMEVIDPAIMAEISQGLESSDGAAVAREVDELERQRAFALSTETSLEGLDEDELDAFILTEEEVKEKERLWMELNKDYLQQVAEKQRRQEGEDGPLKRPRKRKTISKKEASIAPAATAADATKQLLSKRKYSKKLNYKVLESLFETGETVTERARESTLDLDYSRPEADLMSNAELMEEDDEENAVVDLDVDVDAFRKAQEEEARKQKGRPKGDQSGSEGEEEEDDAPEIEEPFDVDEGL